MAARTVVLVHGFGSSARAWAPQIAGLRHRFAVTAPDLPGHGGAPAPFTLARAVATVHGVIESAERPVHLIGISGGAAVALLACLDAPAGVAGMMLSGGVATPPRTLPIHRAMTRLAPQAALERALRDVYSGGRPEHVETAVEDLRRCGKATLLAALREVAALDLRDRLAQVAVPALVVCGSADRTNLASSRVIAAGVPGAELRIIPGANHLWNLQQPELFNRTTAEFVEAT
ncbi:alpha/beta fold hydrolase [Pseudonocardia sp. TRM90224]|uniref:alpha/beta fold hydrolase n=1 Tax=Pseudonocardia sp. TRM90224 TaxID=2812678 RepID=UPI001E5F2CC1|nr:alpha/beta fold hydrolase [Pseudonocardia sp. TRM90224]